MIEIGGDTGDYEHDRRRVSRAELIGIMRPRVEEILEEVRARLDAAGFDHLPSQQIVLTGGGSQIPGLDDEMVSGQLVIARYGVIGEIPRKRAEIRPYLVVKTCFLGDDWANHR